VSGFCPIGNSIPRQESDLQAGGRATRVTADAHSVPENCITLTWANNGARPVAAGAPCARDYGVYANTVPFPAEPPYLAVPYRTPLTSISPAEGLAPSVEANLRTIA
jgi:hypothetical protein